MMLTPILLAALSPAWSADDGVQVRAFPGAIDFAERYAESVDPSFFYEDVFAEYQGCYDLVGVRDFNLDVPIDTVDLTLADDLLTVEIAFGTIYGQDMILYGVDADTFDACPQFETDLYYAQVTNGRLVAALELDTGFGGFFGAPVLDLRWAEPPLLEGDIETDIAWVPDGAVMFFLEDAIRQAAADSLTEVLPPLLEDFLGEASYAGDYAGLAADLQLSGATFAPESLWLTVDLDLASAATASCEIGNPGVAPAPTDLASPILPLDTPNGADLGVGITEELMGQALHAAWQSGWFCFETDSMGRLLDTLSLFIDPDVAQLQGWATLDSPPQILATAEGIEVVVSDVRVEITGKVDGKRVPIIVTRFDLTGTATPGFDQSLTAMTLSLVDPVFDFHEITLKHVPTPNLVQHLIEGEVEAWAADWARDSVSDVVLFDALYYAWDVALLLQRSQSVDGGLEIYFELYDINDPAVDTVPPEVTLESVDVHKRTAALVASATDDRTEPLAYSWQVNGGGWSGWSLEPTLQLAALPDGDHTVEVVARDVWLNVDPTPDSVSFTVRGPASEDAGCGCTSAPSPIGWLALLPLLGIRRR